MSLHTNRWYMACFLCNFQGFRLLWAASAKILKKLQFPCFSHCSKASLLWFHCAKGPSPVSFVHCQGFLLNLSMTLHTNRWHMAYFLCNFSKFSLCFGRLLPNCWKSCSFHPFNGFLCRFLVFPVLWGAPPGTSAEKVAISMLFPLQDSLTFMISLR